MDFLVCQCGRIGLEVHVPLEDLSDQDEAVRKAEEFASATKEGCTVGLFTHEGIAICGWKVLGGGKLRAENKDSIQAKCFVGPGSFESAKRQTDQRKNKDRKN